MIISIQAFSYSSKKPLAEGKPETAKELMAILGTSSMPPLLRYMFNGIAMAFTIISAGILLAKRFENNHIVIALNKKDQNEDHQPTDVQYLL